MYYNLGAPICKLKITQSLRMNLGKVRFQLIIRTITAQCGSAFTQGFHSFTPKSQFPNRSCSPPHSTSLLSPSQSSFDRISHFTSSSLPCWFIAAECQSRSTNHCSSLARLGKCSSLAVKWPRSTLKVKALGKNSTFYPLEKL